MSRYDIILGKPAPPPKKKAGTVMSMDTGRGDSTSVAVQTDERTVTGLVDTTSSSGATGAVQAATRRFMGALTNDPLGQVFVRRNARSSMVNVSPPSSHFNTVVQENFQIGELVGANSNGEIIRLRRPGEVPVGVVVDMPSPRRVYFDGRAARAAVVTIRPLTMGEAMDMQTEQQEREQQERMRFLEMQRMVDLPPPSLGIVDMIRKPSHEGHLHNHPSMQRNLKVPDSHVIVDRNEWLQARGTDKESLHDHPSMQQDLKVPDDHVIIDRNEWLLFRERSQ